MNDQNLLQEFGRLVRQTRKSRKISAAKLGQDLNLSTATIYKVEKGQYTHFFTRRRIAQWLAGLSEELSVVGERFASIL